MKKSGFTLMEIVVAVSILGIIGGILYASLAPAEEKTKNVKIESDMTAMKNAMEIYHYQFRSYPTGE